MSHIWIALLGAAFWLLGLRLCLGFTDAVVQLQGIGLIAIGQMSFCGAAILEQMRPE